MDVQNQNNKNKRKTNWGCLALPIIFTLFMVALSIDSYYRRNRPLEEKLREIFKGSGFSIPDDVTDLTGEQSHVDFQGDFTACMTFTVKESEVDSFLYPSSNFKPASTEQNWMGDLKVPKGTYIIEREGPGEIIIKYGVNKELRRVYYHRVSW